MVETAAIDAFLGQTLRAIRSGRIAAWIAAPGEDSTSSDMLNAVWSRIEVHGLVVLLHDSAELLSGWPDRMIAAIAEDARINGLWEATHAAALSRLLAALDKAGIEAVLMKGTALAYSLHDEPATRRRGDSDLIIRPADCERARAVFAECGWYRNKDPHGLVFQESWLIEAAGHFVHALDLHWEPSDRPVLQRVLRLEDFFTHKQPLPRLSNHAYRADHALTLIHETLNQKWHVAHGYWTEQGRVKGARRLIWSVDFDLLARRLGDAGWQRLLTLCAERGVGPLVAEALRGAASDLDTPLPRQVLATLEAQPADADIAQYFANSDSLSEFWLDLRTATSWSDRLRMVLDRGFPPRAHLLTKYPEHAGWPTLLLQARLLFETAGRVLRRVTAP